MRFADTNGPRQRCPKTPRRPPTHPGGTGLPPISVAPGKMRDGLRDLDAAYAFAIRDGPSPSGPRATAPTAPSARPTTWAGRRSSAAASSAWTSLRAGLERRGPRGAGGLSPQRAGGPPRGLSVGLPGRGRLRHPDLRRARGGRRRLRAELFSSRRYRIGASLEREPTQKHKLTGGLVLRQDTTYGLQANANLDLRTLTPVESVEGQSLAPLPGAVEDQSRTTSASSSKTSGKPPTTSR